MTDKKRHKDNGFNLDEYVRKKTLKIEKKSPKLTIREAASLMEANKDKFENVDRDADSGYRPIDF